MTDRPSLSVSHWLSEKRHLTSQFLSRRVFADGDLVFRQGDEARCAFFIEEGQVDLSVVLPGGAASHLATLGPGDIMGEVSLVSDRARSATALARGCLVLWVMDRSDLQSLSSSFDAEAFEFLRRVALTVADRICRTQNRTLALLECEQAPPSRGLGTSRFGDRGNKGAPFDPLPFLPKLPFFSQLPLADQETLLSEGELWTLERGEFLFRAGEAADFMVVVLRGAVSLCLGQRMHSTATNILGPGVLAGVCALLLGKYRSEDCLVRESSTVLVLHQDSFHHLMTPDARLHFRFLSAITRDLLRRQVDANQTLTRIEQQTRAGVRRYSSLPPAPE